MLTKLSQTQLLKTTHTCYLRASVGQESGCDLVGSSASGSLTRVTSNLLEMQSLRPQSDQLNQKLYLTRSQMSGMHIKLETQRHQNHLGGLLKQVADPAYPTEFLIHQVWGGARESSFIMKSQMLTILLVQGPSSENRWSMVCLAPEMRTG